MTRSPISSLPGLIAGLLILGGLGYVHFYVQSQGMEYAGPLLVLDHVFALVASLLFFLLCAGVGSFSLTRCGFRFESPLEDLVFSIAIGTGLVATLILFCGWSSALNVPVMSGLLLFLAVLVRQQILKVFRLVTETFRALKTNIHPLSVIVLGVIAIFMVGQALAPPFNWDELMYHIRVPTQFLEQGRIYLPDDNLHAAFVQLVHMLYLPLLVFEITSGPALLSVLFALSLALSVYSFCLRFFDSITASLSGALIWGNTMLLLVAITSRVDGTLCYFLFVAQYALFKAYHEEAFEKSLFLAAVLLGLAIGIKYNGLIYAAALSPFVLWIATSSHRGLQNKVRVLLIFAVLALGTSLVWEIKNIVLLKKPLYSLLEKRRVQPWLSTWYPGVESFASVDRETFSIVRSARTPFNVYDFFTAPERITVEGEGQFQFPNFILLLTPIWLFVSKRKLLTWLIVPALCYFAAVLLYSGRTNLRYLIPALVPLTVAACEIAGSFSRRFFSQKCIESLIVPLLFLTLLISAFAMAARAFGTDVLGYLAGVVSKEKYLRTRSSFSYDYMDAVRYANEKVPKDGRVLMIFESRGYYFGVPVIQDNLNTNWPLLAHKEPDGNCLRSMGISHVLFSRGVLSYYMKRGVDRQIVQLDAFQRFAKKCLTRVYQGDIYTLYKVCEDEEG